MAFAKRLWERRVHFDLATFQLEKTSLINEFTLRGLDPTVLGQVQTLCETRAKEKLRIVPKLVEWPGVTALADTDDMEEWAGVTGDEGVPRGPAEWPGVTVLGGNTDMEEWAGVTVVKGTV